MLDSVTRNVHWREDGLEVIIQLELNKREECSLMVVGSISQMFNIWMAKFNFSKITMSLALA